MSTPMLSSLQGNVYYFLALNLITYLRAERINLYVTHTKEYRKELTNLYAIHTKEYRKTTLSGRGKKIKAYYYQ